MEITDEQKQVMLSGILGDGCLHKTGAMSFNCVHEEYMELKKKLLGDLCVAEVKEKMNTGYKKAPIFSIRCKVSDFGKELLDYTHRDILNELDELGLALWIFDDGSRHGKNNFYNINTHAIDRNIEDKVLIPYFNNLNIFPKILTETKKDGRVFSYLYISKWEGAMELSRIMRKLNLKCYDYKIMPIELEESYFLMKNDASFKNASAYRKTNMVKDLLSIERNSHIYNNVTSVEMCQK
jgi:hypothetical protein